MERSEIWDRFEAGESQWSISRRLGRSPSSIRTHLVSTGFRRPVPAGDWSSFRLSLTEREEISRGLAAGESMRCIASRLGRVGSTVSREVASNGGRLKYSSDVSASGVSTPGPKTETSNGCFQPRLRGVVEDKLEDWWSPLQISEWLMEPYPDDEEMRVSHETIYQSLFIQGRGALRKELWRCLRTGRAVRRPQGRPASSLYLYRPSLEVVARRERPLPLWLASPDDGRCHAKAEATPTGTYALSFCARRQARRIVLEASAAAGTDPSAIREKRPQAGPEQSGHRGPEDRPLDQGHPLHRRNQGHPKRGRTGLGPALLSSCRPVGRLEPPHRCNCH